MTHLADYEKLDLFYLGRECDPETGESTEIPLLVPNNQLTTHAVILGMTGSGKTGLGVGLLEEAAIDRIPAVVIDPKGDMGNLLLSFPQLRPEDFLPWIDQTKAAQMGTTAEELARDTARRWKKGLQEWNQGGERIARMREHAAFELYTPGNGSGNPLSIVHTLEAPDPATLEDNEMAASLVNATVSSLLGIVGKTADPLTSREHILLSSILFQTWKRQEDMDLGALISAIVNPPFERVGVLPLETFYPQRKRMELAMLLNNLLASSRFSAWMEGEPLSIETLLHTANGVPKLSVLSLAHLNDEERMFFVTLLLGRFIGWMRKQQGSDGLNCLLYMDEVFGYLPPLGKPPSKEPLLLLLKQARAFGVGIVLSTQNPVDLDYRGLANIGTWFIGRLHTQQDREHVLGGIGGSGTTEEKQFLGEQLARLRPRSFVAYSDRQRGAILFESRWALSYLRGPLTMDEVRRLVNSQQKKKHRNDGATMAAQEHSFQPTSHPPILSAKIRQYFVELGFPASVVHLQPSLVGKAKVRIINQQRAIDLLHDISLRFPLAVSSEAAVAWGEAEPFPVALAELSTDPPQGALYHPLPVTFQSIPSLRAQEKQLGEFLYRQITLPLKRVQALRLESTPQETPADFRHRLSTVLAAHKQQAGEKVKAAFFQKKERLEAQLEKAYLRREKEQGDVKAKKMDTALAFGVAFLGALFGRKRLSATTVTRTARGMRNAGKILKERGDVARMESEVARLEEAMQRLSDDLQQQLVAIAEKYDPLNFPVEEIILRPRRVDVYDLQVFLVWEPLLGSMDQG